MQWSAITLHHGRGEQPRGVPLGLAGHEGGLRRAAATARAARARMPLLHRCVAMPHRAPELLCCMFCDARAAAVDGALA